MLQAQTSLVETAAINAQVLASAQVAAQQIKTPQAHTQQEKEDFQRFLEAYNDCV